MPTTSASRATAGISQRGQLGRGETCSWAGAPTGGAAAGPTAARVGHRQTGSPAAGSPGWFGRRVARGSRGHGDGGGCSARRGRTLRRDRPSGRSAVRRVGSVGSSLLTPSILTYDPGGRGLAVSAASGCHGVVPGSWPRIVGRRRRRGTSLRRSGAPVTASSPSTQAPPRRRRRATAVVRRRTERRSISSTCAQASTSYSEPSRRCGGVGVERARPTASRAGAWSSPRARPGGGTRGRSGRATRPAPPRRRESWPSTRAEALVPMWPLSGQHHRTVSGQPGRASSWARRSGSDPRVGARWARASRSCARPRWMRERTVPSLRSSTSAISS